MKLLRWKYVLPRFILLLTVVLCVHFGLDPLVRYGLVAGGESAVGAKVELTSLRSSLAQGELMLGPWQIANPCSPLRNLLQADRARLQIDTRALLDKRLVVNDGILRGLRWDTPRTTSGALDTVETTAGEELGELAGQSPWLESGRQMGDDWLEETRTRLEQDLVGQLETPRVARELQDRWPRQAAQMRGRIDALRAQTEQLQGQLKTVRKNPLRSLEQIQQLQQPLHSVQQELLSIQKELNHWPQQASQDRQAIQVARAHDQQTLRDTLSGDGLNGAQLSEQLLGPVVAERLETVLSWVSTIRALAPNRPVRAKTNSARGVDVHFGGPRLQPRLHVRQLALTGTARLGTISTDWIGAITDVSSQPALLEKPTQLHIQGIGASDFTVNVALDRTGKMARDDIRIVCPDLPLPARALGGGTLSLSLSPGETNLQLHLILTGDQLNGQIHLKQPAVRLRQVNRRKSPDKPMAARLARLIGQSLSGIEQLETTVQLAGTLRRPTWRIQSNLGPQLAHGVNQATRQLLEQQATALQASIGEQAEQQLAQLAEQRETARQELRARLGDSRQLVEQLARLGGGAGLPAAQLSGRPAVLKKMNLVR